MRRQQKQDDAGIIGSADRDLRELVAAYHKALAGAEAAEREFDARCGRGMSPAEEQRLDDAAGSFIAADLALHAAIVGARPTIGPSPARVRCHGFASVDGRTYIAVVDDGSVPAGVLVVASPSLN